MSRANPGRLAAVLGALLAVNTVGAADWPQFRGLQRDGKSPETGLLTSWPEGGPPELFRIPLGEGYSGMAVAGGRLYTLEAHGDEEHALCLDAATGRELWRTPIGGRFVEAYGNGPRSTPTLDGEVAYVLGGRGTLAALRTKDGAKLWSLDLMERFDGELPMWGFSASPLVVGSRLILEAGGQVKPKRWLLAGLDKHTGEVLWTTPTQRMSYSSPILVEQGGVEQVVFVNDDNLLAVSPEGRVLWEHPIMPGRGIKIASPLWAAPDLLLVSLSYDVGAVAVRLLADPPRVEPVWANTELRNHFNSSVVVGDFVYGFDNSTLKCLDARTGEVRWAQRGRLGKGSLIAADGHLVVLSENGTLLWVEASPEAYRQKASVQVFTGRTWTSPTLAEGRLYLRGPGELRAFDLRAPGARADAELERLLERHLEAIGGRERLDAVRAVRLTGRHLYNGLEHRFVLTRERPDRYRIELDVMGTTVVQASDGSREWELNPFVAPTPGPIRDRDDLAKIDGRVVALIDRLVVEPDFDGPLVDPARKGHRLELRGLATIDGVETWHLHLVRGPGLGAGREEDWYLDRTTYLPRRKTTTREHPWWKHPYQRVWFFDDYQTSAGLLTSRYYEQEDRMWVRAITIDEVEVNPQIDPALFAPPEDDPMPAGAGS